MNGKSPTFSLVIYLNAVVHQPPAKLKQIIAMVTVKQNTSAEVGLGTQADATPQKASMGGRTKGIDHSLQYY